MPGYAIPKWKPDNQAFGLSAANANIAKKGLTQHTGATMAKSRPRIDDDDDDDDLPRKRKRPADEDEDDDDDIEEVDEKPKKKSKGKKKGNGMMIGLIIGGAVALLFCCGGGGFAAFYFLGGGSARSSFESFQADVKKDNWAGVWDRLDKASQDDFAKDTRNNPKVAGKSGKDAFVAMLSEPGFGQLMAAFMKAAILGNIESVTENGDRVTIKVKPDPSQLSGQIGDFKLTKSKTSSETSTIVMVKQDGKWKVSMVESGKFNK